jgi:hypothetical protein
VSLNHMPSPRRTPFVLATAVLTLLATLLPPNGVRLSAWGAQGHHIVARIAWGLMTSEARAQATTLLGGGMDAFIAAATWADDVRSLRPETADWHFVDIPVGAAHYDAARDCRPTDKGDCIIAEIARARAEVVDLRRSVEQRAESLKFLIHFVGDIHQPLHDVDDHDRGGNDVHVAALRGDAGRATNLHSAWDTGLINLETETEAARANRLADDLKAHPADITPDVVKWAEEGHELALRVAYHYSAFSPAGPPVDPIVLDASYRTAALATIDRQLELGGARLAALLNSALPR